MKNLFGNEIIEKPIKVNIYADESKKEEWFYTGIVVENIDNSLSNDIISYRFHNNKQDIKFYLFNEGEKSVYYDKNNRIVHWSKLNDIDTKNIAERWLNYILDPSRSADKFYAYILGIDNSKLNDEEFGGNNFNNKYNRFFRSAILYSLKTMFPNKEIVVENIYHEEGQQEHHKYFPWHCIYTIESVEEKIRFSCNKITFLPKSHREKHRKKELSNIIQLADLFLGINTSIIHGIENSKRSNYRKKLMELSFPLIRRMVNEPHNKNSSYKQANRIMIRFFPRERTVPDDIRRNANQFYTKRSLEFEDQISGQQSLF